LGEDEKNRGGKGTERSLDYAPFVAPSISPFVAPFEAQGKQGKQGERDDIFLCYRACERRGRTWD